jgi:hypothetical protein
VKATLRPLPVGKVAGLVNLVPKPETDQGYAEINGVVVCATATNDSNGGEVNALAIIPGIGISLNLLTVSSYLHLL